MVQFEEIEVVILQKRLEADDIVSLLLKSLDGKSLPKFDAGSHIDLHIGPNLVRQYSLCPPHKDDSIYEIAVLRDPKSKGGSNAVHDVLQVGQKIKIGAPKNHFGLEKTANTNLLFAGGIGITPILAMAEELEKSGGNYEFHYCARSPAKMAYQEQISASKISAKSHFHFDDGDKSQLLDLPKTLANPSDDKHLYVCGPGGFIEAVLNAGRAAGWREENLHREFFAAPVSDVDYGENAPFVVELAKSGKSYEIGPDDTIIKVLEDDGIFVPYSCSEGICGMCVIDVLEGTPDHRDFVFSDAEKAKNDKITVCCSRSKTPKLVLDL